MTPLKLFAMEHAAADCHDDGVRLINTRNHGNLSQDGKAVTMVTVQTKSRWITGRKREKNAPKSQDSAKSKNQ